MLPISSLLSFQYCVKALESARSSSTFLTSSVILSCCVLVSYVMCDPIRNKKKKFARNLDKLGGPRAFPIIGNVPQLWFPPDEIFSWLESVSGKWGDIVRFWVFGSPKVFVNSYDVAMQLLSRKTFLLKSQEFEPLGPVGGQSLAGAPPEVHPIRRKLLAPGFSRQTVEDSLEIFCRQARKLRDSLMPFADNQVSFDVMEHTGLCAYKIGCETALGHDIVQDLWDVDYKQQIASWHKLLVHLVARSFQPWLKHDFIYSRTPEGKEVNQCFDSINCFTKDAIFKRRQHWEYLKANKFLEDDKAADDATNPHKSTTNLKHECFLDLLLDLEDKKELSQEDVLHDLNIFIVAGYDTTGTALAWILHLLATHPEIQDKCVEEIMQVLQTGAAQEEEEDEEPRPGSSRSGMSSSSSSSAPGPAASFDTFTTIFSLHFASSDLSISISQLRGLKYLEWCIKEALRLYPVLPWLLRRTDQDIELSDGRLIPAGVDVPINTFIINRDPNNFPEPDKFNPDRYSSCAASGGGGPSYHQLSFGAGPRVCPGMLFAMHELKVILAHLLLAFKWESNEQGNDKKMRFHGVLVPHEGIHVKITKRAH